MLDSIKQKKNSKRIKMRIKTGAIVKVINGKEKERHIYLIQQPFTYFKSQVEITILKRTRNMLRQLIISPNAILR